MKQRIAIDRNRTPQLIGELLAVAVGLEQGFVKRNHQRSGSDIGVVNHLDMKSTVAQAAMGMDRHRDHASRLARHPAYGRRAILGKGADGLGGVHDLEGIQRRGQRSHDIRLGHGDGNIAVAGDGVPAGQHLVRVNVGHGTGGGDLQIAPDQQGAHRRPGEQRRCRIRYAMPSEALPPRPATGVSPMTETCSWKNLTASGLKPERSERGFDGMDVGGIGGGGYRACGCGHPHGSQLRAAGTQHIAGSVVPLTASISAMGVMPAMGSLLNCPIR